MPVVFRVVPSAQMELGYILVAIGNLAFLVDFGIVPTMTYHVATLVKAEKRLHAMGMGAESTGVSIETKRLSPQMFEPDLPWIRP